MIHGKTVTCVAWEVYPVSPLLTTYIMPFGENLAPALNDFERVYALVQATEDNITSLLTMMAAAVPINLCDRNGANPAASITPTGVMCFYSITSAPVT